MSLMILLSFERKFLVVAGLHKRLGVYDLVRW